MKGDDADILKKILHSLGVLLDAFPNYGEHN